jgi:ankyrin repeat protein
MQDGGTPLHAAVTAGQVEVLKVLLKHGANIDVGESTVGQQQGNMKSRLWVLRLTVELVATV